VKTCGFAVIFDNQYAHLSEPISAPTVDTKGLLSGLQDLPPGGKLLPFFQETLGLAITPEMNGQQLLEQLSAKLDMLEPAEAEAIVQSLSGLIQQLNTQTTTLLGNLKTDALAFREQPSPAKLALSEPLVSEQPVLQTAGTGADKVVQQLQLQSQAPEGRQFDLALLMSTLKHQQAGGVQRMGVDRQAGSEPVSVAGNAAVSVTTGSVVASSVLPTTSVQTLFGQADWDQSVGERVQWMVGQKMQAAQVKLNPANLGPMEVRIQIQNDQASIQFSAHNAAVREALEAALPRLRDMFEASGVELTNVDVSGQSFAEQKAAGEGAGGGAWSGGGADADTDTEQLLESKPVPIVQLGRLDLFA
ncbi:hypothetical protein MNBD_GAMMA13-794, partial [hydrothermal vent metagenome]